jgi:hypothetical protein
MMDKPIKHDQAELSRQRQEHATVLEHGESLPRHLDLTLSEALVLGL